MMARSGVSMVPEGSVRASIGDVKSGIREKGATVTPGTGKGLVANVTA